MPFFRNTAPIGRPLSMSQLVISCLLALFITYAGLTGLVDAAMFTFRSRRTEGEIVRIEKHSGGRGTSIRPIYSYRDETGHEWEGQTDSSRLLVGQKITILYDSSVPSRSSIDDLFSIWFSPLFVSGLAGIFIHALWRLRTKYA